jgi:ADP-ribosylglycohydrolase
MNTDKTTRAKHLLYGAFVADAAAMGVHWLYDQDRIKSIAPSQPEFLPPEAKNYDGVPGYFAHENRTVGDQSQYGYQALAMLRSLQATQGQFQSQHYARVFQQLFGYGGEYVGYIDNATKQTLNNVIRAEDAAFAKAKAIAFDGDEQITKAMVGKSLTILSQIPHNQVKAKFEEAVRITHDDDAIVAYGLQVLHTIQTMELPQGADDQQFPATSKLPPLMAALSVRASEQEADVKDLIQSAIAVTHDHTNARDYGQFSAALMAAAIDGQSAQACIDTAIETTTPKIAEQIRTALSMQDSSIEAVTQHFGLACDLQYGLPSICFNVATSTRFIQAIRSNIYAGGDNCGRAMILGAVMGALHGIGGEHGIPEAWIERLAIKSELDKFCASILTT